MSTASVSGTPALRRSTAFSSCRSSKVALSLLDTDYVNAYDAASILQPHCYYHKHKPCCASVTVQKTAVGHVEHCLLQYQQHISGHAQLQNWHIYKHAQASFLQQTTSGSAVSPVDLAYQLLHSVLGGCTLLLQLSNLKSSLSSTTAYSFMRQVAEDVHCFTAHICNNDTSPKTQTCRPCIVSQQQWQFCNQSGVIGRNPVAYLGQTIYPLLILIIPF